MTDKVSSVAASEGVSDEEKHALALATLRSPETIRARCAELLALAGQGELNHFQYHADRLPIAVEFVHQTMNEAYPSGEIPFHSRWRHFAPDGDDRWQRLATTSSMTEDACERARSAFDLVITSVLLDAGAGDTWQYKEANTGKVFKRSEGLAIASLALFANGKLSSDDKNPLRADAAALSAFTESQLAEAFQVSEDNPLVGVAGRAQLLQSLGGCVEAQPELFGSPGRLGHLFDVMKAKAVNDQLPASTILDIVLTSIGRIWPGRLALAGHNLGDVWRHSKISRSDETTELVPFHKLSQWLSYSLIEPLTAAGITVTGLDALTGLAEYRNGGLFVDLKVLTLKDPLLLQESHDIGSELIVEWRALTVALLDQVAQGIRQKMGLDAQALPLVKVLEGGTWSAGRRLAFKRSAEGAPPIRVTSDGTVF